MVLGQPWPGADASARIEALFAPWNRSDAPGLTVGIAMDGETVWRQGYGMASLEAGCALSPSSRLRIGSTTKHMTALLALLLAEDGALDLDRPVRTWLPELEGPGGDPSVRQLLGHRGGSRCYLDLGFIAHGMATPPRGRALAMQARQKGRNFEPDAAVIYNNGGYHLVSEAIERAGGAPFTEQLRARLFEPLGMLDTLLVESDQLIVPGMATPHVPVPGGGWRRGLFPSEEVRGEGGVVSTIDDMLRWVLHLRTRDRFGRPHSWAQLIQPGRLCDGSEGIYALGLLIEDYRGRPVLHHAGGVIGGSSQMLTFPEDGLDVVILANGAPGADPTALAEQVADILLADRLGERLPDAREADAPRLLGHWWSPDSGMVYSISAQDGLLKLSMCGGPPLPLRRLADGRLRLRTGALGDILLAPAPDADGRLVVRFGTSALPHVRVDGDPAAFAPSAAARYRSADADCVAEIRPATKSDEAARLVLGDAHGRTEMLLEPLSDRVALARRQVGQIPFGLCLIRTDDGGFLVGTSRTRFLAFVRD